MTDQRRDRVRGFGFTDLVEPDRRAAYYIDGMYLYNTTRNYLDIDWLKFRHFVHEVSESVSVTYCTASDHSQKYRSLSKFLELLQTNGFRVTEVPYMATLTSKIPSVVPNLIVDMIEAVDHTKDIVLFAGDNGYIPAIKHMQKKGARIILVASRAVGNVPPELIRAVDHFVDIENLRDSIARDRPDPSAWVGTET